MAIIHQEEGCLQCLPLVILISWDAEIRRFIIPGQPGHIVHDTRFQPIAECSQAPESLKEEEQGRGWCGEEHN